jgi:pimeloyl-ACP methyl ester carboxylesterase
MRVAGMMILCLVLVAAPAGAAIDPAVKCLSSKLKTTAGLAKGLAQCHAKAASKGTAVDPSCITKQEGKFDGRIDKAESKRGCLPLLYAPGTKIEVVRFANDVAASLTVGSSVDKCASSKIKAAGNHAFGLLKAHSESAKKYRAGKLGEDLDKANSKLVQAFNKAEGKRGCQTTGDEPAIREKIETFVDYAMSTLSVVGFETNMVPSAAQAPETPGTPGVDPNDYPKLVTQFGGTAFDLNNGIYTRAFYQPGTTPPEAILILIPGFEGGGGSFRILAENLVPRARESGLRLEVWSFDRRGHQLEDREGLHIARDALDPQIALDWYFGAELGLTLHPDLVAGPNRRAEFHNTHEETAFIANWTGLVFSHDIDAVVDAARAAVEGGENVFLGGHSAGTGFTARYASTNFNPDPNGPAAPGYAKLRGLVLLEGGGGSTSGAPPSEDDLDRIEDRADGGLFYAVRDSASRCVDGTACTVATEAVDCAGKGRDTCTEPTEAYAVIPGLLNPRVLAASEPGAVQGLSDPDTGQVIIQVDQGAGSAVTAVPDLFILSILIDPATAEGALGTFMDDDGLISAGASFVRTSVGAPDPDAGALRSWLDITEGPMPPSVLPDNGPPPISYPPSTTWGQEVEVARMTRLGQTFIAGQSQFTDWYYPSSGTSTTSGIGLDSTPLSIGRGRTDIENLTEAANINIPVICFGGSNGLTPVPASYVSFASSIGTCTQGDCDGVTPRVVDPNAPSSAFPTLGDVNGGFEVYISEGIAHVDVVALEDDSNSQLYGPLVDFLIRNAP